MTDLSGADLSNASLDYAYMFADLPGADLHDANLQSANLGGANLSSANLRGANLRFASLVNTNLTGADLTGCHIFGLSAWGLKLDGAKQENLILTDEPKITVDHVEVAQFDPSSIPKELEAIVPSLAVPVQPLLEGSSRPYAMFKDYWKYEWVLPVYRYEGLESLLATLAEKVIVPAEGKVKALQERRRMIEAELTKPE
jgi:hypothetical protein